MPPTTTLLISLLLAGGGTECVSVAECNRLGSAALAAGDHRSALQLFESQVDHAETALKRAEDGADPSRLGHAREIAVNNAMLASLRGGDCGRSRAWLEAADPEHKASIANRRLLLERCAGQLESTERSGEYWQYAGHGGWNRITLRSRGDGSFDFSAHWIRVGGGPLQEFGPAAIGEIAHAIIDTNGRGRFEGYAEDFVCELTIDWSPGQLEIRHSEAAECHTGGMGAVLHGQFWRVADAD